MVASENRTSVQSSRIARTRFMGYKMKGPRRSMGSEIGGLLWRLHIYKSGGRREAIDKAGNVVRLARR